VLVLLLWLLRRVWLFGRRLLRRRIELDWIGNDMI
jgi:hypothetical protein